MTYPPQPGQPYDPSQQPAQPDPYAQNPGQPMPPQQPQYDPYAPQQPTSGVPYGQQPPADPYAQNPGTQQFQLPGQQPMYGAPPAPAKNKVGLFAAIGGGALVVIIGLIVLLVALSGGGPKDVVDDYLKAVKAADFTAANELVCSIDSSMYVSSSNLSSDSDLAEYKSKVSDMSWETIDEQEVGDSATVKVKITSSESDLAGTTTFKLEKVDGDWKVCGASDD